MLEMASALVPVLVSVTFFVPLVVPVTWFPKERLVEERETVCAAAQPVISPKARIARIDLPLCRCIAGRAKSDEPKAFDPVFIGTSNVLSGVNSVALPRGWERKAFSLGAYRSLMRSRAGSSLER